MNYAALITVIRDTHQQAQASAAGAVNRHLILRNWLIGAYLVEFEQNGEDRAKYGERLLSRLAQDLATRQINGLGVSMLKSCRQFFRLYPQIRQPAVGELPQLRSVLRIGQPAVDQLGLAPTPLVPQVLLRFSWTHFLELIRLNDPWQRAFY